MSDAFAVVRQFEAALCAYTGARYAVTVTSCTAALMLAVAWHLMARNIGRYVRRDNDQTVYALSLSPVEIPRKTYVSVPQAIIHAGGRPTFRDEAWTGCYQLKPLPIWDSARWLTSGMYSMYRPGQFVCLSFHWSKHLAIQQGGAILHDDPEADAWLRRARFDGRAEGVAPKDDHGIILGWHCYMSPETAAAGLIRLGLLPKHNEPLPNDCYPDLSTMDIFK